MNPRNTLAFRLKFACALTRAAFGFAKSKPLRDDESLHSDASNPVACMVDCYPFPSCWSGPVRVRPVFFQATPQSHGLGRVLQKFQFKSARNAVESWAITTNQRGSSKCIKPLLFLPFARWLCLAACVLTPPRLVRALGQSRVSRWARLPKTTLRNRPWSAALLALWRAMRALAADLAAQTATPSFKAGCGFSVAGLLQFHARASGPSLAFRGESYV